MNDKRWRTYIKDDQARSGKRMIAKSTEKAVFDVLIPIYNEETKQRENAVMTLRNFYPTFLEYKRIHTDAPTSITRLNSDRKTHYSKNPIIDIPTLNRQIAFTSIACPGGRQEKLWSTQRETVKNGKFIFPIPPRS